MKAPLDGCFHFYAPSFFFSEDQKMKYFTTNVNSIFAEAKEENNYSLVERLEQLMSELMPLAKKEYNIAPASKIIDALCDYVLPLLEKGECNRSLYWERKGVDTASLPLQEVLDWCHSYYYCDYDDYHEEYKTAYMAVYNILVNYTDLFVGKSWLDSIWKDRTLAD